MNIAMVEVITPVEEHFEEHFEVEKPQVKEVNQDRRRSPLNTKRYKKDNTEQSGIEPLVPETKSGDYKEQSGRIFIIAMVILYFLINPFIHFVILDVVMVEDIVPAEGLYTEVDKERKVGSPQIEKISQNRGRSPRNIKGHKKNNTEQSGIELTKSEVY